MAILIFKILSTVMGAMMILFSFCMLFDETTRSKSGIAFLLMYFIISAMACWL